MEKCFLIFDCLLHWASAVKRVQLWVVKSENYISSPIRIISHQWRHMGSFYPHLSPGQADFCILASSPTPPEWWHDIPESIDVRAGVPRILWHRPTVAIYLSKCAQVQQYIISSLAFQLQRALLFLFFSYSHSDAVNDCLPPLRRSRWFNRAALLHCRFYHIHLCGLSISKDNNVACEYITTILS